MKSLNSLLFLLAASPAFASNPLLMKVTYNSGFVPPEYAYSIKCEIHADYTYVDSSRGASSQKGFQVPKTKYTKAIPNARVAVQRIKAAAKADIYETDGPTDGPTSTYIGVAEGKVVDQYVKIALDYSHKRYFNTDESAREDLIEFGQLNCPNP